MEDSPWIVWKKARNYRDLLPDQCCATCGHIEWDWDCVQYCTEDEERWSVSETGICDKWKKKE
jgi:hypothetical protein